MNYKLLTKIFAIIITIVLAVILFLQISIQDVIELILSINPIYLIAGFFLYLSTYIMRALRFSILLDRTVHFNELLPIICVHGMMNNLLPARTGELSYIYLLKKMHARTTGEGVATLVVSRVFDFIMTILLLFASGLFIQDTPSIIRDLMWFVYILLFALLIGLIAMISYGRSFIRGVQRLLRKFHMEKTKLGDYILHMGEETVESLEKMDIRKNLVSVSVVSLSIWLFNIGTMVLIFTGMGIELPLQNVIFGATFLNITLFLPINGIAGFGTTETIWTLVFVPLGMTVSSAIISGFSYHILTLIYIFILGMIGSALMKWKFGHQKVLLEERKID